VSQTTHAPTPGGLDTTATLLPCAGPAKKGKWQDKREAYRAKASESFIEKHAGRMADRQAEIRDKVLDTIDLALDKSRSDLKATKPVRQPDGSVTEVPAWYMTPEDLCLLIDRFQVLFERLSVISQHQGHAVSAELSTDARGLASVLPL
jgi:hypothetical protein